MAQKSIFSVVIKLDEHIEHLNTLHEDISVTDLKLMQNEITELEEAVGSDNAISKFSLDARTHLQNMVDLHGRRKSTDQAKTAYNKQRALTIGKVRAFKAKLQTYSIFK